MRSLLRDCRTDEDYRECVADNLNFFLGKNYHAERFHETVLLASASAHFFFFNLHIVSFNVISHTILSTLF